MATALCIPYILVNPAVSAASRRTPFRPWVSAARLAVRRADLIFAMSPRDIPALARLRGPAFADERLLLLPPAVDIAPFEAPSEVRASRRAELARYFPGADGPLCLCVAMMRLVAKLDSYQLLAAALARLGRPWRLLVVGDGPARPQVEAALTALPADRIRFLGSLEPQALPPIYLGADLLAFPGIGEEYGLVYQEAAAAGLPSVACQGPGPDFMVPPGGGLLTEATPEAFAEGLGRLLDNPEERLRMGEAARRFVAAERSRDAFRRRLGEGLRRLTLL
ncbi:MAG: glycosyltransferase family 4 protein [Candidatus Methylomirabilota bacterium]